MFVARGRRNVVARGWRNVIARGHHPSLLSWCHSWKPMKAGGRMLETRPATAAESCKRLAVHEAAQRQ